MRDRGGRSGARCCNGGASLAVAIFLAGLAPVLAAAPLLAQAAPAARVPLAAESALSRGDREGAIRLATTYTGRNPDDVRGWLALGRARLAASRDFRGGQPLQALWAFRRASEIDPRSREAWTWMGRAAMILGGADGEAAARPAWERVLALDPADSEAWSEWLKLTRGRGERERVRRLLAQFLDVRAARVRTARLLIEDERYDSADVLLDELLRDDPVDGSVLALRAQSAFEARDTAAGSRFYARALASADRDSADILWAQAIGIATPTEIRAWEAGIPTASRAAFLAGFWARRNPDLFRGENARLAEHFARLRHARKRYPLMHALTAYHRNAVSRASELRPSPAEEAFYLMCEAQEWPGAPMRAADRARLPFSETGFLPSPAAWRDLRGVRIPGDLGLGPGERILVPPFSRDLRDIDTTAVRAGYNLRTGLDDRGLTYLRLGPPAHRAIGAPNVEDAFCRIPDLERWDYPGIGQVRFFRPSAVSLGPAAGMRQTSDMVIRAQNDAQFSGMVAGLTRDTTSVPAPLPFGVWIAQFRSVEELSQVDLAVFATERRVAGELVGAAGVPGETVVGETGLAVLTAPPGPYSLLVHANAADSLGRRTLRVRLREFTGRVALSDVVAAPSWGDTTVDRATMLARAARDLSFAADGVIRVYAEVYGLPRTRSGTVRYRASYQIVRTDEVLRDALRDSLAGGIVLSFERERPAQGTTAVEWLDVTPDLPPGRCILRLTVIRPDGVVVGRSQFAFETVGR